MQCGRAEAERNVRPSAQRRSGDGCHYAAVQGSDQAENCIACDVARELGRLRLRIELATDADALTVGRDAVNVGTEELEVQRTNGAAKSGEGAAVDAGERGKGEREGGAQGDSDAEDPVFHVRVRTHARAFALSEPSALFALIGGSTAYWTYALQRL